MTLRSNFGAIVSPMGTHARRRPTLTLKAQRLDDGGLVERDVDVAPIDRDFTIDRDETGGFLGSPEIGGARGSATNPNVTSGLIDAQNELDGERSFAGRVADFALGSRSLSFDPVTGTFTAERDWGRTAFEKGVPMMFGPLGPVVSLGMRAGKAYGTPRDNDDPRGGGNGGANMRRGGRVRMADGGLPPAVQALISKAMSARGGQPAPPGAPPPGAPPQGQPPQPPQPPKPFRFVPDPAELQRRYAPAEGPASLDGGALRAAGGRSGLIRGPGDGRSDDVDSMLEEDGYVIPASEVSAAGEGSTEAGAERIAREVLGRPEAAQPLDRVDGGTVPAKTSTGEMWVAPEDVRRVGGPGVLEQFVKQTRSKHVRDLKKRPGPRR